MSSFVRLPVCLLSRLCRLWCPWSAVYFRSFFCHHLRVCAGCTYARMRMRCWSWRGDWLPGDAPWHYGIIIGVGVYEIRRWASARRWGLRGLRDWGWHSTRTGVTLSLLRIYTVYDEYTRNTYIMIVVRIFVSVVNLCAMVEVSRSMKRKQPYPTIFLFCFFVSIWGSVAAFGVRLADASRHLETKYDRRQQLSPLDRQQCCLGMPRLAPNYWCYYYSFF